mmetsp:Transcript_11477/g.30467  ORF Transcript_11477/g.30467 Transcript_11477/m.30467 type:complete len:907 (-) Transcript_11477:29-2749(-)
MIGRGGIFCFRDTFSVFILPDEFTVFLRQDDVEVVDMFLSGKVDELHNQLDMVREALVVFVLLERGSVFDKRRVVQATLNMPNVYFISTDPLTSSDSSILEVELSHRCFGFCKSDEALPLGKWMIATVLSRTAEQRLRVPPSLGASSSGGKTGTTPPVLSSASLHGDAQGHTNIDFYSDTDDRGFHTPPDQKESSSSAPLLSSAPVSFEEALRKCGREDAASLVFELGLTSWQALEMSPESMQQMLSLDEEVVQKVIRMLKGENAGGGGGGGGSYDDGPLLDGAPMSISPQGRPSTPLQGGVGSQTEGMQREVPVEGEASRGGDKQEKESEGTRFFKYTHMMSARMVDAEIQKIVNVEDLFFFEKSEWSEDKIEGVSRMAITMMMYDSIHKVEDAHYVQEEVVEQVDALALLMVSQALNSSRIPTNTSMWFDSDCPEVEKRGRIMNAKEALYTSTADILPHILSKIKRDPDSSSSKVARAMLYLSGFPTHSPEMAVVELREVLARPVNYAHEVASLVLAELALQKRGRYLVKEDPCELLYQMGVRGCPAGVIHLARTLIRLHPGKEVAKRAAEFLVDLSTYTDSIANVKPLLGEAVEKGLVRVGEADAEALYDSGSEPWARTARARLYMQRVSAGPFSSAADEKRKKLLGLVAYLRAACTGDPVALTGAASLLMRLPYKAEMNAILHSGRIEGEGEEEERKKVRDEGDWDFNTAAREMLIRAAHLGYAPAVLVLAHYSKNVNAKVTWLMYAANQLGSDSAYLHLARMKSKRQYSSDVINRRLVFLCFEHAAMMGSPLALYSMAVLLLKREDKGKESSSSLSASTVEVAMGALHRVAVAKPASDITIKALRLLCDVGGAYLRHNEAYRESLPSAGVFGLQPPFVRVLKPLECADMVKVIESQLKSEQ